MSAYLLSKLVFLQSLLYQIDIGYSKFSIWCLVALKFSYSIKPCLTFKSYMFYLLLNARMSLLSGWQYASTNTGIR